MSIIKLANCLSITSCFFHATIRSYSFLEAALNSADFFNLLIWYDMLEELALFTLTATALRPWAAWYHFLFLTVLGLVLRLALGSFDMLDLLDLISGFYLGTIVNYSIK